MIIGFNKKSYIIYKYQGKLESKVSVPGLTQIFDLLFFKQISLRLCFGLESLSIFIKYVYNLIKL